MSEKDVIPRKQCAMITYGAESQHKTTVIINSVVAGIGAFAAILSPLLGAAILLLLAGFNFYRGVGINKRIQYLRGKYGLE